MIVNRVGAGRRTDRWSGRSDVYGLETGDLIEAYALQQDTLLYTMDCMILATANVVGAQLVTFDSELLENGALSLEEILE